jgi:hypothetical protein
MFAILTFLFVLVTSIVVVRIATIALSLTGLSHESAKFQARSAWTGTGFTTAESEKIVNHPVRRRIITMLMVVRGAGLVSMLATLLIGFGRADEEQSIVRVAILILGVALLWAVAENRRVDILLRRVIRRLLKKYTGLDTRDYASLFHIGGDYGVSELTVEEDDWLAGRTLADLRLSEEGALVLAIVEPDGTYRGAPRGTTRLEPGEQLLVYGRAEALRTLDERKAGLEGEADARRARREQLIAEREENERIEAEHASAQSAAQTRAASDPPADSSESP